VLKQRCILELPISDVGFFEVVNGNLELPGQTVPVSLIEFGVFDEWLLIVQLL